MSTHVATSVPAADSSRGAKASRQESGERRLEVRCPPNVSQQLVLDVRRTADGRVKVRGTCSPPGTYEVVEISAGWERAEARVDANGFFSSAEMPGPASHVKVTLRGGPMPPIVLTRVPVVD